MIKMPTLVYSRVSGYYNPINSFNAGKKAEFRDRKYLKYEFDDIQDEINRSYQDLSEHITEANI